MRIRSIAASLATTALLGGAIVVPATAALAESSPAQNALGNRSLARCSLLRRRLCCVVRSQAMLRRDLGPVLIRWPV